MIEQLMVKDYILFDEALIDFTSGLSVITGETGAGKSLLIDAIGYLMGERISGNIVRKGKDRCILQMVLSRPSDRICEILEENGFEVEDQLIVTRIVTSAMKSTVRLNQQITTLHFVKKILSMIIDVHSQRDTFYLMDETVQMDLLDRYAGTMPDRQQVKEAYQTYKKAKTAFEQLKNEELNEDMLESLSRQYNEIESLWISQEEFDLLQERIREQGQAHKRLEALSAVHSLLNKEYGITDSVYDLYKMLRNDKDLETESDKVHEMYFALQEIGERADAIRERIEEDAQHLDVLQQQEYELKKAIRKYGGSLEAMAKTKEDLMQRIERILHRDHVLEKLEKEVKETQSVYMQLAQDLSKRRKNVLKSLCQGVELHFHDLMLEKARFQVECTRKEPSADGIDHIVFTVSMNPGQPFLPLKQAASGGELSRLMLALKVVFHSKADTDTLLFDEIDTGVSGRVAFKMGEKMSRLSDTYQVLCITHLASVAAWADAHFCVSKMTQDDETITHVRTLDPEGSVAELALMASGQINDASLKAAKELKDRVRGIRHG